MVLLYIFAGIMVIIVILYLLITENKTYLKDTERNINNLDNEEIEELGKKISNYKLVNTELMKRSILIDDIKKIYFDILNNHDYLNDLYKSDIRISNQSQWLLDNISLIEKEYNDIILNFPKDRNINLPYIYKDGLRVWKTSEIFFYNVNFYITEEKLERFFRNIDVTSKELWYFPLFTRIVILKSIKDLSEKIVQYEDEILEGENLAHDFTEAINDDELNELIKKFKNDKTQFTYSMAKGFLNIIKSNAIKEEKIVSILKEKLKLQDKSLLKMMFDLEKENKIIEKDIGNCINSLRFIDSFKWANFFEKVSQIEKILLNDPSKIYENMDFESRDYYRHKIEQISSEYNIDEKIIARALIECCDNGNKITNHIGYYLIDKGINELYKKLNIDKRIYKSSTKSKLFSYIMCNVLIILLMEIFIIKFLMNEINSINIIMNILAIVPISEIAKIFTNYILSHTIIPDFIPKLSFDKGIEKENSTLVIIPAILTNKQRTKKLMKDLETYYLSCREDNMYFALCGDFSDSKKEKEKLDDEIIKTGMKIAKELNEKYGDRFLFLNRKRIYNKADDLYMGWERKRGKILELNKLLRKDKTTSYSYGLEFIDKLPHIEYVITLDADTKVPIGALKKLLGAMCHPLNYRYNIMQPRIVGDLESSTDTEFIKSYAIDKGIDIYSNKISNIYQDIFKNGIFMGKGIYRVDKFKEVLENEFEENSILSHDLVEGCLLNTAFLSDVYIVEGFPLNYYAYAMRLHRWVRGDLQNVITIFNKKFDALSKYKIIDNIRRILIYPTILTMIIISIIFNIDNEMAWINLGMINLSIPLIISITTLNKTNIIKMMKNYFLLITFFLHESYLYIDAIFKTTYRMIFSKKNLLQWKSAFIVENEEKNNFRHYVRFMMPSIIINLFILVLVSVNASRNLKFIIPFVVLWFLSPVIAYLVSSNWKENKNTNLKGEFKYIRTLSRKTWAYFEDFVNEENNYLGPDNYQEDPIKGVAHRTSPTNIAMTLSSNCCAYDLGYIGINKFILRTKKTLCTLKDLETMNGQYYNWYDTITLNPLYPRYISTVDNGNLLSYLWLLKQCIKEYKKKPIINKNFKYSAIDIVNILNENNDFSIYFDSILNSLEKDLTVEKYRLILMEIRSRCKDIEKIEKQNYWIDRLKQNTTDYLKEIQILIPWVHIIDDDSELCLTLKKLILNEPLVNVPDTLNCILKRYSFDLNRKQELEILIRKSLTSIEKLLKDIESIENILDVISNRIDFSMLYDEKIGLLSIGYDVESRKLNNSYYDLMASEARIASFVAIAKGDIPKTNWNNLGRHIVKMGNKKALVSWSGTMFEYLMPLIILKNYDESIWNETYIGVVNEQKTYGIKKGKPWGISESGYFYFDENMVYQYKAFGIPQAGLKKGIEEDFVISPYSTIMALMVDFKGAIKNLKLLDSMGSNGKYGLYEAVDYNKERVTKGKEFSIIKSFMIHHQGMSFMSLNNVINNNIFRDRFHRDARVKSCELLLQEKCFEKITFTKQNIKEIEKTYKPIENIIIRNYNTPHTKFPEIVTLSNGDYNVVLTNRGSGYSKLRDINLYRWRKDFINDNKGMYFYIKDVNENKYWSATYEPARVETVDYRANFAFNRANFSCNYNGINSKLSVDISNENNLEIRILELENLSDSEKILEITTYTEITLTSDNGDIAHPAFSNLFINTEELDNNTLLAYRRPRQKSDTKLYGYQRMLYEGDIVGDISYETSRLNFIGRGKDLKSPIAVTKSSSLKNSLGAVLDPIFSQRIKIRIKKGEKTKIYVLMGIEESKEDIVNTLKRYDKKEDCKYISTQYGINTETYLKFINIKYKQALLYDIVGGRILYNINDIEKRRNFIKDINKSQKDLWSIGISGDKPIITISIEDTKNIDILRQWIQCYKYLNSRGIIFDLFIINNEEFNYNMKLKSEILALMDKYIIENDLKLKGKLYIKSIGELNVDTIRFIKGISTLVIDSKEEDAFFTKLTEGYDNLQGNLRGVYSDVAYRVEKSIKQTPLKWQKEKYLSEFSEQDFIKEKDTKEKRYNTSNLKFFNGFGGFNKLNEYVIVLNNNKNTPAPWINVICNNNFGFHISESGASYTWYKNSRENKLTPWSNDFISDTMNECLFLRDDGNKETWSLNTGLIRDNKEYLIQHGFGYSKFYHSFKSLDSEIVWFTPLNDNLKIGKLKIKNNSSIDKTISITYYSNLVLGVTDQNALNGISTYYNNKNKYVYAENPYNGSFKDTKCYLTIAGGEEESYCCSKKDFIGIGRGLKDSIAMEEYVLNKELSCGIDGCLSYRSKIEVKTGDEKEVFIIFGAEDNLETIDKVITKYNDKKYVYNEFYKVKDYWSNIIGKYKINTPDEKINILMNGWLIYQVISCRYYARSAFYQCGGAYGFRDQLQDSLSILLINPNITRQQIILSASRQFEEGDVQHWWHPIVNSGMRTKFSDDLLWLPYVTIEYIYSTGDYEILNEKVKYLKGDILSNYEHEKYGIYQESDKEEIIYKHCKKAIERSFKLGSHGLPLIGCGDWNDGMSNIGTEGKGESVWLAWFLSDILSKFEKLCDYMKDYETKEQYKKFREEILNNIELNAWDGKWYRRAYFDNGTPLGSIENTECIIDSLPQSWSVISNGKNKERQIEAMDSVENHLVNRENGIIQLLYPPFDKCDLEPGYIKGYIPGVRENGGQYTHAAIWVIMANLLLGYNDRAYDLINMINPINHTMSSMDCEKYKVEPYVISADVYMKEPHGGRGGWSWYTGAASWMYKVILENFLGFKLRNGIGFYIEPKIPLSWDEFEIEYKKDKDTLYKIKVKRKGISKIIMNGIELKDNFIEFKNGIHEIEINII